MRVRFHNLYDEGDEGTHIGFRDRVQGLGAMV